MPPTADTPRTCVWCEVDISAIGAAKPVMYARWGGPEDNWQCMDEDACEQRQDRLDIRVGIAPRKRKKVLALTAATAFPFPLAEPQPDPMLITRPCGCTSMTVDGQPVQVSWCESHDPGYPSACKEG